MGEEPCPDQRPEVSSSLGLHGIYFFDPTIRSVTIPSTQQPIRAHLCYGPWARLPQLPQLCRPESLPARGCPEEVVRYRMQTSEQPCPWGVLTLVRPTLSLTTLSFVQ